MVPTSTAGEARFVLLSTTRYVNWVAVGMGALLAAVAPSLLMRCVSGGVALALLILTWAVGRQRPVLLLSDTGYRVEVAGRERFRVAWNEVHRVLRDRGEAALYLDCGDGKRNLLVPPATGFAFTFTSRALLVERILSHVGDRVQDVDRFDKLPQNTAPALPATADPADKVS